MTDNNAELVQACLETNEFATLQIANNYFLVHENIIKYSNLECSATIIGKSFPSHQFSLNDVKLTAHVNTSLYQLIIFADRSVVYTYPKRLTENGHTKRFLPYYVPKDLELLRNVGMSNGEIDRFMKKLDGKHDVSWTEYPLIIQRILRYTDIPTRLRCRQVSHQWKTWVDQCPTWRHLKLSKLHPNIDRVLTYFQLIKVKDLDLSETLFDDLSTFNLKSNIRVESLRSLCLSMDHPWELFTFLFQIAPCLEHIRLIQTCNSSLKWKNNTQQLYDCIYFVINQCQERLKSLRRLHIQLRSASDQIFLESSSVASIPISYEIVSG